MRRIENMDERTAFLAIAALMLAAVAAAAMLAGTAHATDRDGRYFTSVNDVTNRRVLERQTAERMLAPFAEGWAQCVDAANEAAQGAEESPESDSEPIWDADYDPDGYEYQGAAYSAAYGTNGPTYGMPGWYDGHVETWYNASAHFMAGEWTVDPEGFYRDANGRYVVGVGQDDMGSMPYGTVIMTGKGEAVVYDYGTATNVRDFAVAW